MSSNIRTADDVDKLVGKRIRLRRTLLQMSQEVLASQVGLTFQQIQKYEGGTNRVSASRLYHMANVLGVPVTYFYGDLPQKDIGPEDFMQSDAMLRLGRAVKRMDAPMVAVLVTFVERSVSRAGTNSLQVAG